MLLPGYIKYIMIHLEEHGHPAYLVGGAVRDMFMEKETVVHDFDITTSATPSEISQLFRKVIPTGIEYGTVTVQVRGRDVEVTTLHKDGAYRDNRHPSEVTFTNDLKEDLARRDFTINAIAIDLEGNVYDPFGGLKDIEHRRIRAVGDPNERFQEDPLRMMRAIRFACTLPENFRIYPLTYAAIRQHSELINNISKERIRDELCKIITSDNPYEGVELLRNRSLLKHFLPELDVCYRFEQHNPNHDMDVFYHTLEVLENTPPRLNVRLAALLHDIGKPKTFSKDEFGIGHFYNHHIEGANMCRNEILPRLKFDNKTINAVSTLIREHMSECLNLRKSCIKKLITRVGKENIEDFFALQRADILGWKLNPNKLLKNLKEMENEAYQIIEAEEALTVKDLAINGYDLMEIGIEPGPIIGGILNNLLEAVLENPELNTKESLLGLVNAMR